MIPKIKFQANGEDFEFQGSKTDGPVIQAWPDKDVSFIVYNDGETINGVITKCLWLKE